jgi:hypothetical protein
MTTVATDRSRTRVSSWLRPLPFRGDLIAAGAVVLAVGVLLLEARFADTWAAGPRLLVAGAAAALLLALGLRAPVEGPTPRIYVSVLLVAALPLVATALVVLAQALGAGADPGAGTVAWTSAAIAVLYGALARLCNSAICTLAGAASAVTAVVAGVAWIAEPDGPGPYRWVLLGCVVALALATLRLRDRHRRHAVSLVDVAGIAAAGLGLLSLSDGLFGEEAGVGWGWELVLLALGFSLVAYAGADRERGPGYLGALVLALFVGVAASDDSLLWWPLLLVVLGGAVVIAGLRPTTPAPPPPDADAPVTVPRPIDG